MGKSLDKPVSESVGVFGKLKSIDINLRNYQSKAEGDLSEKEVLYALRYVNEQLSNLHKNIGNAIVRIDNKEKMFYN